jgi:MTH538 TIR-like domain (DUF1863).
MARRVFFSFHYENDINRTMVVRNSWVLRGVEQAGFKDKAEFEEVKRRGKKAIENWIDEQLKGTTVTVVLIGEETLERPYVQYEICQSLNKGNSIIGVKINNIKDMRTQLASKKGNTHTVIGNKNGENVCFDNIAYGIYDYINDDGYNNFGKWIENAANNR